MKNLPVWPQWRKSEANTKTLFATQVLQQNLQVGLGEKEVVEHIIVTVLADEVFALEKKSKKYLWDLSNQWDEPKVNKLTLWLLFDDNDDD